MIIHICGAPGAGKTTLSNKFKLKLKNVIVEDLDDLLNEFLKKHKFNEKKYQIYIDDFINKYKSKDIIFVGINSDWFNSLNTFYNLRANIKLYIDISIEENIKRLFLRDFNGWLDWMKNRDHLILYEQLKKDEKQVIEDLTNNFKKRLSLSSYRKDIENFNKIYKQQEYKFMKIEKITDYIFSNLKK